MIRPIRVFQQTDMSTDCEVCGRRFDLMKGGACERCRRVLCPDHLHGSFTRRLFVDIGGAPLCVQCRAGTSGRVG